MEGKIKFIITKHPQITQKEIADLLKVSRTTIQREIKLMLAQKKIERIGSKRSGTWKVIDKIWGHGVEKIQEACQAHSTPNPEFKLIGNDITVKFTAHKNTKTSKPQHDALNDALDDTLSDALENKIKFIITKHPKITQKEIADLLQVSRATIQREIKLMLAQKKIERIGSKRSGTWKVIDKIWGGGAEKIQETCQAHGTPNPEFKLIGNDITVKFTAHKNAKTSKPQNDALNDALEEKIKFIITKHPQITQKEIADLLQVSRATIQREIKLMLAQKKIERIGSKRFGFWKVIGKKNN